MKCERCGKVYTKNVEVCEECGYDFKEGERVKKILNVKKEKKYNGPSTDLVDAPIFSFVFGILGLIIPIYVFSVLAVYLGKKQAKESFQAVSNVGRFFGYLGFVTSTVILIIIGFTLF